ncbi:MAG: hypothetical protein AAF462_01155 [Thermodesulfobacteriota bacterium]
MTDQELAKIGELIFINEGGGKIDNLTTWNEGEEFASLGIGHFIWYPKDKEYRFYEIFPVVYEFIVSKGIQPPLWMSEMKPFDLPWDSREQFYFEFNTPKMISLREFLVGSISQQTLFMAMRLENSLPKILEAAPPKDRENIKRQFYRVANSPMGMYVLIDYVNFKGEGTLKSERYKGQGWGLLQILQGMKGTQEGLPALEEFAQGAQRVLLRRVANSPPERGEKRWIPGWKNRIKTYTSQDISSYYQTGSNKAQTQSSELTKVFEDIYRNLVCGQS